MTFERCSFEVQFIEYTETGVVLHVTAGLVGGGQYWSEEVVEAPQLFAKATTRLSDAFTPEPASKREGSVQRMLREAKEEDQSKTYPDPREES